MPSSDTQFRPKPSGDAWSPKPICCRFSPSTDARLRLMPDRSEFIRAAVERAMGTERIDWRPVDLTLGSYRRARAYEQISCVYALVHTPTALSYVGQTSNLSGRIENHRQCLRNRSSTPWLRRFLAITDRTAADLSEWEMWIIEETAAHAEREEHWIRAITPALNTRLPK